MAMNYIEILIFIGVVIILLGIISQMRNDIFRLQTTLNNIAKQVGVPDIITEDVKSELSKLVAEGKSVEAIKKYRILTGAGLKESKEYIDNLNSAH